VLAQLADDVYSIERLGGMLERARANLLGLKLSNLRLAHGDGNHGLEKAAPFNSIIVAAAAAAGAAGPLRQLALGGRMITSGEEAGCRARRAAAHAESSGERAATWKGSSIRCASFRWSWERHDTTDRLENGAACPAAALAGCAGAPNSAPVVDRGPTRSVGSKPPVAQTTPVPRSSPTEYVIKAGGHAL